MNQTTTRFIIRDQAIETPDEDAFAHESVAIQLEEAIRALNSDAVIGLIGPFGAGKTSIANMCLSRFDNDRGVDALRVSAEKHTDVARSRNITHSVGAALSGLKGVSQNEVDRTLLPLRQATTVVAVDPSTSGFMQLVRGRLPWKQILGTIALPTALGILFLVASFAVANARWSPTLGALAVAVFLFVGARIVLSGVQETIRTSFQPGETQDATPRAEAADDVERVFADLVELHNRARSKRSLVVFIDDLDRLDQGDVLDALRTIKSLQAVPSGKEPVFVVSCDERVVRRAIQDAEDGPAGTAGDERGDRDAAQAYLDKFFTLRIPLPPHVGRDMRSLIQRLIPEKHPLRGSELSVDLEVLAAIIVHDDVRDPRRVVRLLNAFLTAFRLAALREDADSTKRRIHGGDVTRHAYALARLTTLFVEFRTLYDAVVTDHGLLAAADRLAQGQLNLDETDRDLLVRHGIGRIDEGDQPVWIGDERLRRYLVRTFRYVEQPPSLAPLVYFAHSEAGRVLGNQRLAELVQAIEGGDAERVADAIDRLPNEQLGVTSEEIQYRLNHAAPIEAVNLLAAVTPAVERLEDSIGIASAAVDLLNRSGEYASPDAETLETLLQHAPEASHESLHRELVRPLVEEEATDAKMRVAALRAARTSAPSLREAVEQWLGEFDGRTWAQWGPPWLKTAEELRDLQDEDLLNNHVIPGLIRVAQQATGADPADLERLANLGNGWRPQDPVSEAEAVAQLSRDHGPLLRTGAALISQAELPVSGHVAGFLAKAVAHPDVPSRERCAAIECLGRDTQWSTAEPGTEDSEETGDRVADHVANALAGAIAESPEAAETITQVMGPLLDALQGSATPVLDAAVTRVTESWADEDGAPEDALAAELAANLDRMPQDESGQVARRLLEPVGASSESDHGGVPSAVRLIPRVATTTAGYEVLGELVASWVTSMIDTPADEHGARLRGLEEVLSNAPTLIDEPAGRLLQQLTSSSPGTSGGPAQAHAQLLATFPWPGTKLQTALNALDERWDHVPVDAQERAVRFVAQAAEVQESIEVPERLVESLMSMVKQQPGGATTQYLVRAWSQLSDQQQIDVLAVAATNSQKLSGLALELPEGRISQLLHQAQLEGTVQDVLALDWDVESIATGVVEYMKVAIQEGRELQRAEIEGLLTAAAPRVDDVLTLADESLPASQPVALIATSVLLELAQRGQRLSEDRLVQLVHELLPEADERLAHQLGLLAGSRVGRKRTIRDLTKELAEGDNKGAVQAFTAAFD